MKTPTRRKKKPLPPAKYFSHQLHQPPVDLFGEVVVTEDDLYAWIASVSPVHLSERAYANYMQRYDVAGKVLWAKLQYRFDSITVGPGVPWHARLALHAIL